MKRSQKAFDYTSKQGQYLAFIYWYTKLNRRAPAETDIASYFGITPESAHGMMVRLQDLGFIERVPGQPRSIRLLIPREELPDLE
jgi:Mn-dependent DtxR family transcriptional regulator